MAASTVFHLCPVRLARPADNTKEFELPDGLTAFGVDFFTRIASASPLNTEPPSPPNEPHTLIDCVVEDRLDLVKTAFASLTKNERIETLCYAIAHRRDSIINFLRKNGVSIFGISNEGITPLNMAIACYSSKAIELIQQEKCIADPQYIAVAIYERNHDIIRLLLEKTLDIPAVLEVVAREVLKENSNQERLTNEELLVVFSTCFPITPLPLMKEILEDLDGPMSLKDLYRLYSIAHLREDRGLIKLLSNLSKSSEAELKEALAYCHAKNLSHLFGLDGQFYVGSKAFSSEGLNIAHGTLLFKNQLEAYMKDSSHKDSPFLSQHKKRVKGVVDKLMNPSRSVDQIVAAIKNGEPEMILSGWVNHTVGLFFHNGIFVQANRGEKSGDETGLEFFTYNPDKVSRETVITLLREMTWSYSLSSDYILNDLREELDLQVFGHFDMSGQEVGNCSWANAKALYLAMVITFESGVYQKDQEPSKQIRARLPKIAGKCKDAYKAFTKFSRRHAALTDLPKAFENELLDTDFVVKLTRKAKAKGVLITQKC